MVAELADAPGSEWRTKALIREHVRGAISSMLARLEAPFDPQESENYAASLREQQRAVGTALHSRDWSHAAELASGPADCVGLPREALADPALAWRILANTRELLRVALSAEHDCEDPLRLGKALLEEVGLKADRACLKPPISLSEAVEKECEEAPVDVEKMRLWFEAVPDLASTAILTLLGALGAAAILHGSLMALRQERLKLVIAYSTVAQIGYLLLVFPLAGGESAAQPWAAGAWTGAVFHALSHGLAKAAMFLCAGLWMTSLGHDRIEGLDGMARATPMAAFAFGLAAITLMGLPPSGGFIAKYLLLTSALASGQWVWAVVLLLGGLLTAAYLYRPLAATFEQADEAPPPVPRAQQAVPLALAGAAILLGIASSAPFEFLQVGNPQAAAEGLK